MKNLKKQNSVKQMVDVLKEYGPLSENDINKAAFGYDRNTSFESNKKYADMLRRGMRKGLIKRIDADPSSRSQFLYYATRPDSEIWPNRIFSSLEQDMEWANESI